MQRHSSHLQVHFEVFLLQSTMNKYELLSRRQAHFYQPSPALEGSHLNEARVPDRQSTNISTHACAGGAMAVC